MAHDWSDDVPNDVLELIERRLDLLSYLQFGATCKSWRTLSQGYSEACKFPWLMLHDKDTDNHPFFSLPNLKHCWVALELSGKRCCGSSHGWLAVMDHQTLALSLVNPFTRAKIELPPLPSDNDLWKVYLSEDPSLINDYVVLANYSDKGRLMFIKPQVEKKWVEIDFQEIPFNDLMYYKEQWCAVDCVGNMVTCKINNGLYPELSAVTPTLMDVHSRDSSYCTRYLVDWCGEILLVIKLWAAFYDFADDKLTSWMNGDQAAENDNGYTDHDDDYKYYKFKAFKLNASKRRWEMVRSLGDNALFIDDNGCISFSAVDYPGLKGNQIYFTHYQRFKGQVIGRYNLCIFDIKDGTVVEPCYAEICHPKMRQAHLSQPMWITPSLVCN